MAKMYPESIIPYDPTHSELIFYNSLKEQLGDDFYVFYSLKWYYKKDGHKINSEADFLIFNSHYGFLVIEVKGGKNIKVINDKWHIKLNNNGDYRKLKRNPFDQAEESMRYFLNYFRKEYYTNYNGIYGYGAAFPLFCINEDISPRVIDEIYIDFEDMDNIREKIYEMYMYWRSRRSNYRINNETTKKFLKLIRKKVSISEAKGAVLNQKKKEIEKLNRIQDNLLDFIEDYKQLYIKGGAGTGKTWIGIKKIKRKLKNENNKDVLMLCSSDMLAKFLKEKLTGYEAKINSLKNLEQIKNKFDLIVVDEAQDFNEDESIEVKDLLKDEDNSELYILYDPEQDIRKGKFKDYFYIDLPPFVLKKNIRNTKNIYEFAVKSTNLGKMGIPNNIEGIEPTVNKIKNDKSAINRIENIIVDLIDNEGLNIEQIVLLSDRKFQNSILNEYGFETIGKWLIDFDFSRTGEESLKYRTISEFKGLESDIIIFLNHKENITAEEKYIAYTRPRYMLYIIKNYWLSDKCCEEKTVNLNISK